jgi:colanic acid/amylovoran biosynthesis glycosyltransferase
MHSFAYLYERFPSFVQTFVYREASEMIAQGMNPLLVSIRPPEDHPTLAAEFEAPVLYLPDSSEIRSEIDALRKQRRLPRKTHKLLPEARAEKDSTRLFEAAWLGPRLIDQGIRHVHAHFGGMAARTAWWLRELHGITYSFTGHANDIFCPTDFPVSNSDLANAATFVVTETDFAKNWMEEHHPATRGRVFRIYNGIDSRFPEKPPASSPKKILSVGRYVEKKGFPDLIRACHILRDRGLVFSCSIVGEGPLHRELESLVRELDLEGIVEIAGPRSQNAVRSALAEADLFALACVPDQEGGSDNLPTVIMEAMMCGTPVVSTTLAGIPEMITNGRTGLLTQPGNPGALADALAQLLQNPTTAQTLADAARRFAFENFAVGSTTRHLKHLLVSHAGVQAPPEALHIDPGLPAPPARRRWWNRILGTQERSRNR